MTFTWARFTGIKQPAKSGNPKTIFSTDFITGNYDNPAHILITNQLGITFGDMSKMTRDETNWDYEIDYVRVWRRVSP